MPRTTSSARRRGHNGALTAAGPQVRQEYFKGQAIITQGEEGDSYYVIRRGRCVVSVDGEEEGYINCGMGFGEMALVLDIQRPVYHIIESI